jgi:hypothetical protein
MTAPPSPPFEQLDFIYTPSRDVAGDVDFFAGVLGGRVVFAIEDMGTRVAAIELTPESPQILLADHLEGGERSILVYRVGDLEAALDRLVAQGWEREHTFEIPHGPCCSLSSSGGHRVALYQLTRPEASEHFEGRRDF